VAGGAPPKSALPALILKSGRLFQNHFLVLDWAGFLAHLAELCGGCGSAAAPMVSDLTSIIVVLPQSVRSGMSGTFTRLMRQMERRELLVGTHGTSHSKPFNSAPNLGQENAFP
jgi:hypothetical protein